MGIDRIGKGGPVAPPPTTEVGGKDAAPQAERPFEVRAEKTAATAPAAPIAPATTALERLRAGEIDLQGYVAHKIQEATAHLHGVPPAELEAIKRILRDQISTDPALIDLVRHATGAAPPPRDD
jgi:hypothetical protein